MPRAYATYAERGGGERLKGVCPKCSKKMLQKNIQRHLKEHRMVRPQYKCPKCKRNERTYQNESNFIAHYRKQHMKHLPDERKTIDKIPIPKPKWVRNEKFKNQKTSKPTRKVAKPAKKNISEPFKEPEFEFVAIDE